jgi:hypothetical protein
MNFPEWLNPMNWGRLMVESAKGKIDEILLEMFENVVEASFDLCLVCGMIGLIFYILGIKKGGKVAYISPVIYILIKILGGMF